MKKLNTALSWIIFFSFFILLILLFSQDDNGNILSANILFDVISITIFISLVIIKLLLRLYVKRHAKVGEKYSIEYCEKIFKPSIAASICVTLSCLGPYCWLFIYIYEKNIDRAFLAAAFSFPCIVILTLTWVGHYNKLKTYKEKALELYNSFTSNSFNKE